MKTFFLTAIIAVFLLCSTNGIQAQTDTQAEKLVKALKTTDCTSAKVIVASIDSVDYMDKDNFSLLMYASAYGCIEVVKALLEKGAKLDLQKNTGETALMMASSATF